MAYDPSTPYDATVKDLLESCLSFDAGAMKIVGWEGGKPAFVIVVAVREEAERLLPEIERLIDRDTERPLDA